MKSETKNSWMIWAVIVLAVMNVSTLATIFYHQYRSEQIVQNQPEPQSEVDSEKFSGRYFRDKLNLSGEQMEVFRKFNPTFRQNARAITIKLEVTRKLMLKEMATLHSDTSMLNVLSDSIGHLHRDLKKITYRYYLDLKSICNASQQKQLEQLFNEMFTNDLPMSFPGRGGSWKGHGNRMLN